MEGSTRLACLHQEKLKERFDAGELIPVKLTVRDIGESDKEFLRERSRLQSISNVMVVVEWGDVPKAKKIYEYYKLEQEINPGKSERERIKEIADTLGMTTGEVKTFVYRYAFFKELSDNCYDIKEKDFKYLEGLHQNISIQNKFGLDRKSMDFEWNLYVSDDDINEDIEVKQQLLYMIPEIIEIAKDEKIKSKLLRDILRRYQDCEVEDLYQKFNDICIYSKSDDYSNDGFLTIFSMDEESVKEKELKIKTSIKNSLSLLKGFPINEDFSPIYLNKIKEIRRLADNIINSMENCIEK